MGDGDQRIKVDLPQYKAFSYINLKIISNYKKRENNHFTRLWLVVACVVLEIQMAS